MIKQETIDKYKLDLKNIDKLPTFTHLVLTVWLKVKDSENTCFSVIALDVDKKQYILYFSAENLETCDVPKRLAELARDYVCGQILVTNGDSYLAKFLADSIKQLRCFKPVENLETDAPVEYILQFAYDLGRIAHVGSFKALEEQLTRIGAESWYAKKFIGSTVIYLAEK